jgi:hypothetical protein
MVHALSAIAEERVKRVKPANITRDAWRRRNDSIMRIAMMMIVKIAI